MKYEFITDPAAEGQRIDACIRRFLPELPARTAQQSFARRDVKLDGKRVRIKAVDGVFPDHGSNKDLLNLLSLSHEAIISAFEEE